MEAVLAVLALISAWIVYGHVSRLREDVETLRKNLARLQNQISTGERPPEQPRPVAEAPKPTAAPAEAVREAPLPPKPRLGPTPQPPKPAESPKPEPALPWAEPIGTREKAPPPPPKPPKPKIAWEQQIGAKLPVWIGGIALALSGIFLVKYSIDTGLLNPAVRCVLAGILGVAMLAAAQAMLMYRIANGERIAQALSGAGVAVLYGTLFAASTVYGFISPTMAFIGMAANTALAVVLALRQGPPIAMLGMIGGFVTPALIGSTEPNAPVLFTYLIALTVGLFTVARRQQWWWITWPTIAAAFVWVLIWLAGPRVPGEGVWLGIFLMMLMGSTFVFVNPAAKPGEGPPQSWLGLMLTAGAATLLMGVIVQRSDFGLIEWGLYVALTGGTIALAARDQANYRFLPWLSLAVSLVLLRLWPPAITEYFAGLIVLFAAMFTVGGITFMWRARDPVEWARLACVSAFAFYGLAFFRLQDVITAARIMAPHSLLAEVPIWGTLATFVATAVTLVTGRAVQRFGTTTPQAQSLLAYLSLSAIAFMGLGLVIELAPDDLPVAVAGLLLAVAWVEPRVNINVLRPATTVVATLFAVALLPQAVPIIQYAIAATLGQGITAPTPALVLAPIFHLGIPAALFLTASFELRRRADDTVSQAYEVVAALLAGVMGYFLIRQFQTPAAEVLTALGNPFDGAVISHAIIVYGIALVAVGGYFNRTALSVSGIVAAGLGLARVIHFDIQPLQLANVWLPMALGEVSRTIVTLPIATSPLFYLGIPAVLLLGLRLMLGRRDDWLARTLEYVPVALGGLMGYFLIRHAFNPLEQVLSGAGSRFEGGIISQAQLAYAIALVFAAQFFKRNTLATAAIVAAGIAVFRITAFDIQIITFLEGAARLTAGLPAEGTIPIASAPLFHLGIPAILLGLLSFTLRSVRDRAAEFLEYVAILFVALMGYYLIRQAFNAPGEAFAAVGTYLERGVITNALLIFGVALYLLGRTVNRRSLFACGVGAALFAIFRLAYFDYLTSSPLVAAHDVGAWPVLNALLLPYGLPVIWLALLARALQDRNRAEFIPTVKGAALISLFAWVSLSVRHYFQGPILSLDGVTSNEVYAYSAAWLVLGVGLLVAGTAWKDKIIRFASLALMVLTVGKVFLYDARELEGLLRVASFFGLGASLLGLSWFYTRYVFVREAPKPAA
jgi:uncharacterized membrane protein